jgi:hypothetical protein
VIYLALISTFLCASEHRESLICVWISRRGELGASFRCQIRAPAHAY